MVHHIDITVAGRVQAVGFRYHAQKIARELGITGSVQNRADGNVRIEAEGTQEQLQQFLEWCQKGPDGAAVSALKQQTGQVKNYAAFEIIKQ